MTAIIDDFPKLVLLAMLLALTATGGWAALDRRSSLAGLVRQAWVSPLVRRALFILIAAIAFAAVAEDVLEDEDDEWIVTLDVLVHDVLVNVTPALHEVASVASRATGEGLAVVAAAATVALVLRRRWREAIVLTLGGLGAWAISGGLKILFLVPRPRAELPMKLGTSYGFPSGHALVTLVIGGLLVWALGRRMSTAARCALWAGVWSLALLAGSARVVLGAHWPSDVAAGLSLGAIWLNGALIVADARRREPAAEATARVALERGNSPA